MNKVRIVQTVCVLMILLVFLSGASVLVQPVFDIPFGNLLVPIGFLIATVAPYTLNHRPVWLSALSMISVTLALLWLPVGIWLSGNVMLNFVRDSHDSYNFLMFTYVTIFCSLSCLLISWIPGDKLKNKLQHD